MTTDAFILQETRGHVGLVQLNRPEVLNALSPELMAQLVPALETLDADPAIHCLILTGLPKAFAAGADISQMATASTAYMWQHDMIGVWDRLAALKKPIIAAVSGYALGGGCEIALMCDMILASDTAQFGQPEVNIGVIPGAGGSQRLLRTLGKALTTELILTGRRFSAQEAYQWGLVNKVVPADQLLTEAWALAETIAQKPTLAVQMAKTSLKQGLDAGLTPSLAYERSLFYGLFGTFDQKEGMAAFLQKRPPAFQGQ
jgi:enoyl-CoA hydratase